MAAAAGRITFAVLLNRGRGSLCLHGAQALGIDPPRNGFEQAVVNGQGVPSHGPKIHWSEFDETPGRGAASCLCQECVGLRLVCQDCALVGRGRGRQDAASD
jgi:hypothetical protein